jgi:hypothetical protein
MRLLKRLFGKKHGSESKNREESDLQKFSKHFESLDQKQIENLKKPNNELKKQGSTKAKVVQEFIEAGLEYNKIKRAEKIVNEYGRAIMEASELNKRKFAEFEKNIDTKSAKELLGNKASYYQLQNKFDNRLLPYDKQTIKESIELLLNDETDVSRIEQLKIGLLYLDDFIDFSEFE